MSFRDESRGKPDWVGVNASERLSFARFGKVSRGKPRRKPESGNPTFRDCRGASVNVVMVGMCTRLANRKSEDGNPPPTTGATELYPDHVRFRERLGVTLPGPTLLIVFHEASLRRTLNLYFDYYHRSRTYLSLGKDSSEPRPVQAPELGRVVAVPQVGGLHHRYERRAA
jgi:hypothetical protein